MDRKSPRGDWYEYLTVEDFHTPAGQKTKATINRWMDAKPSAVFVHELRGESKRNDRK